jgi:hypothetical protein
VPNGHLELLNGVFGLLNPGTGRQRQDVSNKFCRKLQNIFVTSAGSTAYGVWEVPGRGNASMFIALSPQAFLHQTLADQENKMLAAALGIDDPAKLPNGLFFQSDDQPGQGMALLAILAHELGHLLLADKNADGTGGGGNVHPRSNSGSGGGNCDPPAAADRCFENNFLQPGATNTLWNATLFHANMRRWIDFGGSNRRNNNEYKDPNHDLSRAIAGNYSNFLDGEFVSFYAAVSPEEDFVETYKYKILADVAQASNLRLNIPGGSVFYPFNNVSTAAGNLGGKLDCVNHLTP